MGIRKLKPTTPGQRHKVIGAFDKITASTPEKSLVVGKRSTGGRNNTGKMTMRYIGGGHKRMYRVIDFLRDKDVTFKNSRRIIHRAPHQTGKRKNSCVIGSISVERFELRTTSRFLRNPVRISTTHTGRTYRLM